MFHLPANSQMPECGCCSVGSSGDEEVFEEDGKESTPAGVDGDNSAVEASADDDASGGEFKLLIIMLVDKTL